MGTTAEKLKYLNETKAEIKNALETPYNVMRDYPELIKKYIDNQPTKVVTDGICGNAVDVPVKAIEINGNIRQETTEGYNILQNIVHKNDENYTTNGITFTKNNDGSIVANGTATANTKYYFVSEGGTRENIKAGTYRITGCPSGGSTSSYRLVIGITKVEEKYDDGNGINITVSSDNTYYFAIFVHGGQTVSNLVFKPMIVSGTEDKPYEPYTGGIPSPNPDYPQEITNVGENGIKIKQSGKNKLDFKKILKNANVTYTEQDGVFNLANNGNLYSVPYKLNLKPNTTYTIYQNFQEQNSTNVRLTIARGSNYEKVVESYSTSETESYRKKTFATDESSDYYIRGDWSLSNLPLIYNKPILVEGTDDASYEPYHEPIIIPINLQGNSLSKAREVKDILKVNRNGEVEIKKNIGKVILDGTENLFIGTELANTYSFGLVVDNKTNGAGLCNSFITKDSGISSIDEEFVQINNSGKIIYIRINKERLTSKDVRGLKTFLSSQKEAGTPVIVYYKLATPQTISLPSISPIELWQGTNIFKLITNLDTDFEVEYVVDKDSVTKEEE